MTEHPDRQEDGDPLQSLTGVAFPEPVEAAPERPAPEIRADVELLDSDRFTEGGRRWTTFTYDED